MQPWLVPVNEDHFLGCFAAENQMSVETVIWNRHNGQNGAARRGII
jgi:hypothetical protein